MINHPPQNPDIVQGSSLCAAEDLAWEPTDEEVNRKKEKG